jgi:hydroxyacylglutathione hydrolase
VLRNAREQEVGMGSGEMIVRGFAGGAFGENSYLVSCARTGEAIIVDPGAAIGSVLEAASTAGARVGSIVLTHAHIDHVEGLAEAKDRTGAPVSLHRADAQLYGAAPTQAEWFGLRIQPLPPVDRWMEEGDRVEFGDCTFSVLHTPGHAPGHVILVSDGLAIVGDCVFLGSIGRTDLPGGDFQTLMQSIRSRILTLPDETQLYTGHGPETSVGHERATNPFLTPSFGGSTFA